MKSRFSAALVAAFFVFFSTSTFSQNSIDVSQLTSEQKQELAIKAAEMKQTAPIQQTRQTIAQVQEWANFGTAIGVGIVATAKELGVAANDFAKTDLGRTVVNLVIWKYFGRDIMGIVMALLCLFLICPTGVYLIITGMNSRYDFTYERYPLFWGLVTIKRAVTRTVRASSLSESEATKAFIGVAITFLGFLGFVLSFPPSH